MKILLDEIMYKRNLTERQVEIMTGVSQSSIGRIKNHQVSPTMDTMEKLAKGLHIRINDLFESDFQ